MKWIVGNILWAIVALPFGISWAREGTGLADVVVVALSAAPVVCLVLTGLRHHPAARVAAWVVNALPVLLFGALLLGDLFGGVGEFTGLVLLVAAPGLIVPLVNMFCLIAAPSVYGPIKPSLPRQ